MKSFVLTILLVTVLASFTLPPVHAKGSGDTPTNVVLPAGETVDRDYFAVGDTVRVSGTVNGDAYIAGGSVTVDGTVRGDLLVAGGSVTVNGTVEQDIRAAGGTVTVSGTVGGNVTAGAGTLEFLESAKVTGSIVAGGGTVGIASPIGRDATVGGSVVTLDAPVSGNVLLGSQTVTLLSKATVGGDLTYWSEEPVTVSEGATVSGELIYHPVPKTETDMRGAVREGSKAVAAVTGAIAAALFAVGGIAVYLAGLLMNALFPKFIGKSVDGMRSGPVRAFVIGLLTVILLPMVALSLIPSVVGIPLALFLFLSLGILCVSGHIITGYAIGSVVFRKRNKPVHAAWRLLTGLVILLVLWFIPFIGWLAHGIAVLAGTGALVSEKYSLYRYLRTKHLI